MGEKSNNTNITGHGVKTGHAQPATTWACPHATNGLVCHGKVTPCFWSTWQRLKGRQCNYANMQWCQANGKCSNGRIDAIETNMQLDIVGQFQTWTLFHTNSHLEVRAGCRPLRRLNCLWNVKTFRAKYDPHTGASIRAIRAFDRKTDTVSQVLWHLKPRDVCSLQLCKRSLGPMSPLLLLSHGLTSWLRCTCNFSPRLPNLRLWAGLCHWAHLSLATCGSHRLSSFRRSRPWQLQKKQQDGAKPVSSQYNLPLWPFFFFSTFSAFSSSSAWNNRWITFPSYRIKNLRLR